AGMDLPDAPDDHREDRRAAVLALVAVHRGDNDVLQVHRLDGLGDAVRLVPVYRRRATGLNVAEAAGAGAGVAQHEERRGPLAPALAEVGAHGLLADGMQFLTAHQAAQPLVRFTTGRADANPLRAAAGARRRIVAGRGLDIVEVDDCHQVKPV